MRGHIQKRGKDSYTIVLDLGTNPQTGKRKQKWISVKGTKKDAEKRLSELIHQIDTGNFVHPSKTSLAQYLHKWLADYAKPNLSPRGYERYESIVRVHLVPGLGSIALTQLRPDHVQQYYTSKLNDGLSTNSVRYHHVVLHVALQTAVKWGIVGRNVADAANPPRAHRTEMKIWDENEISRFLEAAKSTHYHVLFYLALFTGMRRSELLALRWHDVDLILGQVSISRGLHNLADGSYIFTQPKSAKSRRTIALSPSTILLLRKHQENQKLERTLMGIPLTDNDLIFSSIDGKPFRPNTVSRAWTGIAVHAGLKPIRFHDARHSHASLMLKQGIHPKVVQERLGHSSIAVTLDTYSHVAPGLQELAAKRFDEAFNTKYNEQAKENVR